MVSRNSPSLYNQGVYLIDRGECARRQNLNTFLKDAMGNLTVGKARIKSKKQNEELCWCHKTEPIIQRQVQQKHTGTCIMSSTGTAEIQ